MTTEFEILDERFERLFSPTAHLHRLYTGCRWAEGPAYFPAGRYLIWSDIPVGDKLNLTAQFYGENLTNNRFINFATDFSSLATVVFNRPRNYGLRLTAEF